MADVLALTLWNTEWAKPGSARGRRVAAILHEGDPDIICVTEGYPEILSPTGHIITGSGDHGYGTTDGRRKVILWSRKPWTDIDVVGSPLMPTGRFICGTTETIFGSARFVGVCIPWHNAHVVTGRRNRKPWEDHLKFLDGLEVWLRSSPSNIPTVLLGDFNQRIPRAGQSKEAFDRIQQVLGVHFSVVTGGALKGVNTRSIDHVAVSSDLDAERVETFDKIAAAGMRLSDHFGLRLVLKTRKPPCQHPLHLPAGC